MAKKSGAKIRDMIAAAGVIFELVLAFVRGLGKRGVTGEHVYALATEEGKPILERVLDAVALALAPIVEGVANSLVRLPFDWSLLGSGWSVDEEVALFAPGTPLDAEKLGVETCMKQDEGWHTGEDRLNRLQELDNCQTADAGVFMALWREEGHKTLEYLYKKFGVQYLYFFGTVFRGPNGRRYVLSLFRDGGGRWSWSYDWLDRRWSEVGGSVVLRK